MHIMQKHNLIKKYIEKKTNKLKCILGACILRHVVAILYCLQH